MPDLDCDQVAIVGLVQGGDCSPPSITTDLLFVVVVLGRRAQGLPKRRKEGERERDAAVLSTAVGRDLAGNGSIGGALWACWRLVGCLGTAAIHVSLRITLHCCCLKSMRRLQDLFVLADRIPVLRL